MLQKCNTETIIQCFYLSIKMVKGRAKGNLLNLTILEQRSGRSREVHTHKNTHTCIQTHTCTHTQTQTYAHWETQTEIHRPTQTHTYISFEKHSCSQTQTPRDTHSSCQTSLAISDSRLLLWALHSRPRSQRGAFWIYLLLWSRGGSGEGREWWPKGLKGS